jgi:hypothetical protein
VLQSAEAVGERLPITRTFADIHTCPLDPML